MPRTQQHDGQEQQRRREVPDGERDRQPARACAARSRRRSAARGALRRRTASSWARRALCAQRVRRRYAAAASSAASRGGRVRTQITQTISTSSMISACHTYRCAHSNTSLVPLAEIEEADDADDVERLHGDDAGDDPDAAGGATTPETRASPRPAPASPRRRCSRPRSTTAKALAVEPITLPRRRDRRIEHAHQRAGRRARRASVHGVTSHACAHGVSSRPNDEREQREEDEQEARHRRHS